MHFLCILPTTSSNQISLLLIAPWPLSNSVSVPHLLHLRSKDACIHCTHTQAAFRVCISVIYYFNNPASCKVMSKQWLPRWIIISIFMASCSRVLGCPGVWGHIWPGTWQVIGEWSLCCSQLDSTACLFSFAIVICKPFSCGLLGLYLLGWRTCCGDGDKYLSKLRNDSHVACKYVVQVSPQVICLYGVTKGIFSRIMHGCDVHAICLVCCWSPTGNRGHGLLSVPLTAWDIKSMMPY